MTPAPALFSPQTLARVAAWALVLSFFGLSTVNQGFFITFHAPFTRIDQGEANLWLGAAFLLTPAGALLGYGYASWLARLINGVHARLLALDPRERRLSLVALGLLAMASARLMNVLVLDEWPVTDDEWAARFGGQALAQGRVLVELPFIRQAFPDVFMFVRGNAVTSIDWLGTQLAWAVSALTHSGNWIFALSAALPVPCLAYTLGKRLSPAWGGLAAGLIFTAPMAFALSMTTHGHLHSRAFIALALALYTWASDTWSSRRMALVGLALGAAVITRPFETMALLGPFALVEGWTGLREGGGRRRGLVIAIATGLLPVLALVLHAHAVTGGWFPARHSEGATTHPFAEASLWVRFGSNSAFNLLRLGVWFAGPLGVLLVALGVTTDRLTRALGLGILSVLLIGLAHDNYGLHAVGPIHFSECAVPLTLLAVHGLARLTRRARELGLQPSFPVGIAVATLVVVNGCFNAVHAVALHAQARIQGDFYAQVEREVPLTSRPAVVLALPFFYVWRTNADAEARGTWVMDWRRPDPDFSDDLMFLRDAPGVVDSVRAAFPGRPVFRFERQSPGAPVRVVPVP